MDRRAMFSLLAAGAATATLATVASGAASWDEWDENDPPVLVVTPEGNRVMLHATIYARNPEGNRAIRRALQRATVFHEAAASGDGGTSVTVSVFVPSAPEVSPFDVRSIVSTRPHGGGTVWGDEMLGVCGQTLTTTFRLPVA